MSEPLNSKDLCEVATTVTGEEYIVMALEPNGGGIPYVVLKNDPHKVLWKPQFEVKPEYLWRRSQALAVVEWLFTRARSEDYAGNKMINLCVRIGRYLAEKDITALQRLVLELKEPV